MKDILIIAHFTDLPNEKSNGRFVYLVNLLKSRGFNTELVTKTFLHSKKRQREIDNINFDEMPCKLTLLHEPGYKRNISLKRFYSHYIFGKNLKKYLKKRKKPDIIYCAVPSLDAGYVAAQYAKKNNIKFIIDIQDLWPEAFKMVFKTPVFSNFIFYPMIKKANYIYKSASEIVAVSETYMNKGLSSSKIQNRGLSVFLGTDLEYFDKLALSSNINKPDNEIWLAYIGTLGHSYDLTCVIDALYLLWSKGLRNIKFIVMGDGPLRSEFENYAYKKGVYCEFKGKLDYSDMVKLLVKCDIAINPISKGAAQSIINKVGDYAAAGLPVINTQENKEYRLLLDKYYAGINCNNNDYRDLADKITLLYENEKVRKEIGANNRKLAEEKFDRRSTYCSIVELIEDEVNI